MGVSLWLCAPKNEGGLGLMRVGEWNKAAAMKHFWNLLALAGSIWVAWGWGKLFKQKSEVRPLIKHRIKQANKTTNGHPIIYDSASSMNAKISSVLKNNQWRWRPARSDDLVRIQINCPQVKIELQHSVHLLPSKSWDFSLCISM
jgi:hypothetical protein